MKKLLFIIGVFICFQSFGQNRFPSVDSAKNYALRYVRNSTVESFTNLRMQQVVVGTLELLDSLTAISGGSGVDSIWLSSSATKDTIKYSISGYTYTAATLDKASLRVAISDSAAMLSGYTRVQRFLDSLSAHATRFNLLYDSLNKHVTRADTTRNGIRTDLNGKQGALTLTTTGSSGAATLTGNTLNIPQYSGGGSTDTSKWTLNGSTIYPKSRRNIAISDTLTTASVPLEFQGAQKWYMYLTPDNYGTAYPAGSPPDYPTFQGRANRFMMGYARFDNVNPGVPSRPNIVGIPWGYNATLGGGRADTAEAGFQFRTETHYTSNGLSHSNAWFEFHLPEVLPKNGNAYRLWSMYVDKITGSNLIQSHNTRVDFYNRETPDSSYLVFNEGGIAHYTWTPGAQINNTFNDAISNRAFSMLFEDGSMSFTPSNGRNFSLNESPSANNTFNSYLANNNFYNKVGIRDGGLIIGQQSAFANTTARFEIYGNGSDNSTIHYMARDNAGHILENHYDDGKILFNKYSGNTAFGVSSLGSMNNCAKVEILSTTQGLLLPRMTKTQRDAISSPVAGLMIYQTDNTPGLRVYNGTNWMKFTETTD